VFLRSFIGSSCTKTANGAMIDTARIQEESETTLGDLFGTYPSLESRSSVASKASPLLGPHLSLSRCSVIEQCETSLEKLGLDCLDLFYLHSPDVKTDIEDTLAGVEQLHKDGKITEFGLSNYPAWAVVDIWHRCKNRGMVLPTVYQCVYNVLARDLEREVVPVVRELGMRLYVHSPLAAGVLSGRYNSMEDLASATQGRFSAECDGDGSYRTRYSHNQIFEGVDILRRACAPAVDPDHGYPKPEVIDEVRIVDGRRVHLQVTETFAKPKCLDMANIALRWLIHHSHLTSGDGIILGVSKNEHVVANLGAWLGGPLPAELLDACDAAWQASRPVCESYFHGYGANPGGIETFLDVKRKCLEQRESQQDSDAKTTASEA